MRLTGSIIVLLKKDVTITARKWYELASLTLISIIVGVVVAYTVSGPQAIVVRAADAIAVLSVGQLLIYFIAAVSAGFLAVIREAEKGTLEGIRSSPVPPEAVFIAKVLYIYLVVVILSIAYLVSVLFFSGLSLQISIASYMLSVIVTGFYFSIASALSSYMIVYSESRSLLSMVVLAGLVTPYLQRALNTLVESAYGSLMHLVSDVAYCLIFIMIASLLSRPLSEI